MYKLIMERTYMIHRTSTELDILYGSLIRTIGAASTVLLKNVNLALPLTSPKSIGVIGNGAGNSSKGINGCATCYRLLLRNIDQHAV